LTHPQPTLAFRCARDDLQANLNDVVVVAIDVVVVPIDVVVVPIEVDVVPHTLIPSALSHDVCLHFLDVPVKAVLAPVGSRGDVQPMVALGQRMRGAGHDVTLVVAENFRALVEGAGLPYLYGGRDVESVVRERGEQVKNPLTLLTIARGLVDQQFAALDDACEGADLLVGSLLLTAGPSVAEHHGIPICMASYFPAGIPTRELPSPLVGRASGPEWLNRASWAAQAFVVNAALRGPINQHRVRRGLAPIVELQAHALDQCVGLLATDAEVGPAPSDWGGRVHVTGFWFLDTPDPLPADVEAFLDAGEPPVYIGFGSMPNDDPVARSEIIAEACTAVGCRAIVSAGWGGLGRGIAGSRIKTIGAINHRLLFERVAVIVHHGGAGTIAAAARAGVPQVIVPHLFDQFYWASRVETLGLGPPALASQFRGSALVSALRVALEDKAMRARAERMGRRISAYSGADRAVAVLERVVAGTVTATAHRDERRG